MYVCIIFKVMIQALEQDGDDRTVIAVVDSLNSILSLDPLPVILYKIETMVWLDSFIRDTRL